MRAWIVAFAVLVGCKGKKDDPEQQKAAEQVVAVAKVDTAKVLATDTGKPPALFIVGDKDVRLGATESWADLDAQKVKIGKLPVPFEEMEALDRRLREDFALGRSAIDSLASWDAFADHPGEEVKLDEIEDISARMPNTAQDDPPPPEEEDAPDDGEDKSGGTGTAMALEEGKMGKKDSDRAAGQYRMRKAQDDPQLARQQAIEQARAAGILGGLRGDRRGFGPGDPVGLNEDGTPSRVAEVAGVVMPDGKLDRLRLMIVISPTAKATRLIHVIRETSGAIAVNHAGKVRPLHLQFDVRDGVGSGSPHWLEARVTTKGITVEAVPDAPIEVTDLKQLAGALDKARKARDAEDTALVDVLVDPDVDVQRLIDVVVALDVAGAKVIGMGPMPSKEQLARRGHRIPTLAVGQPSLQGDLDKAIIRRYVKQNVARMKECYTKALAVNPSLAGTVQTSFFITPNGSVASASGTGVDPDVASCVAEVIKKIEFPKPKGGGGVQVNYPFTFRP